MRCTSAQGRHPEAAIALERSLLIWEQLVGPDHEAVVESRRQLAELQRLHGLLPEIARMFFPSMPFNLGGTSLLILVVVTMDFMSQLQAHAMSHQYEGMMQKANLRNYGRSGQIR